MKINTHARLRVSQVALAVLFASAASITTPAQFIELANVIPTTSKTTIQPSAASPVTEAGPTLPGGAPATLSLAQAIQFALENNLSTKVAAERRNETSGLRQQALAPLLPNVAGAVSQASRTANLAALGFSSQLLPQVRPFLGPFAVFDARFQFTQSLLDLSALREYQAARVGTQIAATEEKLAREQIAAAAALNYLETVRTQRAVETAQTNLELAQSLLTLAQNQKAAGVATGVDVTRAQTRVADQEVRLAQAQTTAQTARLNLLRVTGLPLNTETILTDALQFDATPAPVAEVALQTAARQRAELTLVEQQIKQLGYERKAAQAELYPSVEFVADYGTSGVHPHEIALPTRSVGVRMNVPLFNGGATLGRLKSAKSREAQAAWRLADTRQQIEQDVRIALQTLTTAAQQVKAAEQQLHLAEQELTQSRDRFGAGVGDNIEVLNGQTSVENARNAQVTALAAHNAARINLAAALGRAEAFRW
jgi:outer membrane protein TolC